MDIKILKVQVATCMYEAFLFASPSCPFSFYVSSLVHNFVGEEYDGFDQSDHGSLGHLPLDVDSLLPSEDERDLLNVLPL